MATMTGQEIVDSARGKLNELNESEYRDEWKDDKMLKWVNEAVLFVRSNRPDSQYSSAGVLSDDSNITDLASAVSIDSKWLAPAYHYVVGSALECHSGETFNAEKSKQMFQKAVDLLGSI